MQQIHHKKNELFEVQFYKDKECTEAFDFKNAKNLYIELINGDITLLLQIGQLYHEKPYDFTIFTPYIPNTVKRFFVNGNTYQSGSKVKTLNDITPNLSKYTPEDNAVLFLSEILTETEYNQYKEFFPKSPQYYGSLNQIKELYERGVRLGVNKLTIFLPHGTQAELQKANEVAKELKEKYGVEEVNLCVLHCFVKFENLSFGAIKLAISREYDIDNFNFNKIITTNSTGILPVQNTERLQVIDCKEIFEEYLKTER